MRLYERQVRGIQLRVNEIRNELLRMAQVDHISVTDVLYLNGYIDGLSGVSHTSYHPDYELGRLDGDGDRQNLL